MSSPLTENKNITQIPEVIIDNTPEPVLNVEENLENSIEEENKYVVLMETSGQECESWYNFIKYQGNEENLKYLQEQLESINWYILDDLSTFDLDLDHFISEKAAKEITKLELNHYSFHRKFDGSLDRIELDIRSKDKNEKKMVQVFDKLGYGQIEDYIDNEDIDDEDLTSSEESSSDSESESGSESESESDSVSDSDSESESNSNTQFKKRENKAGGIPPALLNSSLPRFAKAKRRQRKR